MHASCQTVLVCAMRSLNKDNYLIIVVVVAIIVVLVVCMHMRVPTHSSWAVDTCTLLSLSHCYHGNPECPMHSSLYAHVLLSTLPSVTQVTWRILTVACMPYYIARSQEVRPRPKRHWTAQVSNSNNKSPTSQMTPILLRKRRTRTRSIPLATPDGKPREAGCASPLQQPLVYTPRRVAFSRALPTATVHESMRRRGLW